MKGRDILTALFLSFFLLSIFWISGFIALLESILGILFYSLIFFLGYISWKYIRKTPKLTYERFLSMFLYKLSVSMSIIFLLLGGFSYYYTRISPAPMPRYTLTNGKKILQFQAMVHIGMPEFYQMVKKSIFDAKNQGYVLFFEGVKPGTQKNHDAFDVALGVKFDKNVYKNFSKLYGVTFQDNQLLLGIVNNLDFNIDLSMDEIMTLYQKMPLSSLSKKPGILAAGEIKDVNKLIIDELAQLNQKELQILVYLNQAILNLLIQSDSLQRGIMNEFGNQALFDVILGKRNEKLIEAISESEYDKIYITYGLLHFEGVFKGLKEIDPNWKIQSIEYLYPIKR